MDNSWDVLASQHSDLASFFFSLASSLLLARGAFYQAIKARSVAWKTGGVCSTKVGNRPGNTKKNRYKDVVPCKSLGIFRESGPLAQTLGGSARVAAATTTYCRASTAPQSFLLPVLEAGVLLLEATRGRFLPVFHYLLAFAFEAARQLHTPLHMSYPLADDETRVVLSLLQEEGHGDYINANFIRVRLVTREEVAWGWGGWASESC